MARVISNKRILKDVFVLRAEGRFEGEMGQFYMIRAWDKFPLLSRPLSIHDIGNDYIEFLYKVQGQGTSILSLLKPSDEIILEGPYGNGFPLVKGKIALVGGGIGIAPLYLAAKKLSQNEGVDLLDIYMGFRNEAILEDKYKKFVDNLYININGFITDDIDFKKYDYIFTCGPEIMMKKIVDMAKDYNTKVYVSIEKRMACGVGACLVCSCKTKSGNKRTCKDGPVFFGEDVIFDV
ncbi:dihydroorotate dehydrogenase electron transfer subunit [Caloranaerobacter azorensis]|uniref:Dihydroorotate dehydrogenase electron transfer subunit n=1 Tax=Caloranaerobacter azorensis TaxID=116090 RepID=A0A6P1YDU6_9FIRM|nr:dihydroorotate dehydrogenase electron transfer subunit [Caloranaerobacter azorensis]QIB27529.1 dihydroorotate dehydrogenase electron transfer subunit [Caloranaerobacter azorensis]